jgi:hypothetical protein
VSDKALPVPVPVPVPVPCAAPASSIAETKTIMHLAAIMRPIRC